MHTQTFPACMCMKYQKLRRIILHFGYQSLYKHEHLLLLLLTFHKLMKTYKNFIGTYRINKATEVAGLTLFYEFVSRLL